jgi:hypothetical protein
MATCSFVPNIDGDKRLNASACRSLLGEMGSELSNEAITAMRDQLYAIATVALSIFERDSDDSSEVALLPQLDAGMREAIEERAAVLEFDANMPRRVALRAALRSSWNPRRGEERE